jgi:glycine/D-amino acid oxidase-like deaminating enzyme
MALRDDRGIDRASTDVLVVGGGAAGVAAAVTAAREGLRVTLVERYGFCGGGAVAGLSGTICGLYLADESPARSPEKIVHGFVDEFIAEMESRGGLAPPIRYGLTYTRVHDPMAWRDSADALLRRAGVRVIFHALVTDVLAEGERVEGALLCTKQGKLELRAPLVIDASGDADLIAMAGLPFTVGQDGRVQNPTMIFRIQGVDVDRFMAAHGPDTIMDAAVAAKIARADGNGYHLPRRKIFLFPTPRPGELLCNATRVIGEDGRELNPLLRDDFTEAEVQGRRQVREYVRFFREDLTGCENAFLNDTGVQVGIRQTRQVSGVATLGNADIVAARKTPGAIARSPWPVELHTGDKPRLSWLMRDYYEIPWDCLVPRRGEGVIVAGRCLSAEHEAMASARVTAQCFAYGQAAGLAAAIAVKDRIAPRTIGGAALRAELMKRGTELS